MINEIKILMIKNEAINIVKYICSINNIDFNNIIRKELNNIDLVAIDTKQPEEALKTLIISNYFFKFDNVILFTDQDSNLNEKNEIKIKKINKITRKQYSDFCLNLIDYVNNDYVLIVQHDSLISNPNLWDNKFLEYDYIGAPFNSFATNWAKKEFGIEIKNCVGNGGFSLRSKKFLEFTKIISNFPKVREEEDLTFAFQYYDLSQTMGIKFAPKKVADKFSYETDESISKWLTNDNFNPTNQFGFHAPINKMKFLSGVHMNKETQNIIKLDYIKNIDLTLCKSLDDVKLSFEPISFPIDYFDENKMKLQKKQIANFTIKKNKKTLDELDIVIITKIDSESRLKNLKTVINHLNNFFENSIIIGEYDYYSKINFKGNYKKILVKPISKGFWRNYASNQVYKSIKNKKFLLNIESDVIFDPIGIEDCYNTMLKNNLKFGMPFNGRAIWLNEKATNDFVNQNKIPIYWKYYYKLEDTLDEWFEHKSLSNLLQIKHPGFSYMVDYVTFDKLGLENQNFKSHGFDDVERIVRFLKFDNGIYWSDYFCYHLWHERKETNEWYTPHQKNFNEYMKILTMNKEDLQAEIESWVWNKNK